MSFSPCRICTEPTSGGSFDDHEIVCPTCLDEAVLDAYLADIPDEPIIREQVTRAFFTSRRERRTRTLSPQIEAIEIDGKRLPLPDDLHIDELIELLGPTASFERIDALTGDLLDEDPLEDGSLDEDDFATGPLTPSPRFPALAGELHRVLPRFAEEDAADPEEYPGYRLFRVLERVEDVDGKPRWEVRRVYRRD